ncbi:MAG: c-type cytochrome biosis protein CcmF [Verrucomicrobiaceae bacterium]|nr:c-type cytochrome biosis protein CcmF [Verrucomicrobiaceae bacterium]
MTPELGHFALILALLLALSQTLLPAVGVFRGSEILMSSARSLAVGLLVMVSIAFAVLAHAFLTNDFSVAIVSSQSNSELPWYYQFAAVWGGHEGSLLLWVWILSVWSVAVAIFSRHLPLDMVARVLTVMGAIAVGFLLFMIMTSNPFARILPNPPLEGSDLNPLLQDPGMVIHPPMLYFGYVGFSVAFAFAIAALWSGRLDSAWARWSRPWSIVAWMFLSVGITLGSWWAYSVLGWGGWWFWDPVENASFMPWLVGTALIHSLAVTDKRGAFKSWTVLLAIFAFSLSLLGTFLVRSGVLTSVHSFAADPARGVFILAFLAVVIGGSLTLYALRAPVVIGTAVYTWFSREIFLLLNNVLLLTAALSVLCGTLFPLAVDALHLGKYSVGPPYFNAVFVPLISILLVFLGIGPGTNWKGSRAQDVLRRLLPAAIASVIVGLVFPFAYAGHFHWGVVLTVTLAGWVLFSSIVELRNKLRNAPSKVVGLRRLTPAYYGMLIAHLGFAASVVGVGLTTTYTEERDIRLAIGEHAQIAGYDLLFSGTTQVRGPNYIAERGLLTLSRDGKTIAELHPEKRRYNARRDQMMTEAAVDAGLSRDIYVALGEPLEGGAWAVRLHYKPFVRWIWLGGLLMAVGGATAVADKRYRLQGKKEVAAATVATPV